MQTITIIRQHDKLSILEGLLNENSNLENLVSNFIDECNHNNEDIVKNKYTPIFKKHINNPKLLNKIIKLAVAFAQDKPFVMKISNLTDTNKIENIIGYLNQPFVPFISNYSLPAFS